MFVVHNVVVYIFGFEKSIPSADCYVFSIHSVVVVVLLLYVGKKYKTKEDEKKR